jgi:protein O-GlcNAc transferase
VQARGEGEARGGDSDCQRALAALGRGDLEAAARAYRQAIRRGTRNPDAYNNLGVILAQGRDWDAAIPLFERGLALAPGGADARENLAGALAARGLERHAAGRLDEAIHDLRASLAHSPPSPRTAADLAAVLVGAGRMAEAADQCRRALALAPDFAPAHMNLATALLQQGQLADALSHAREAIRLAPDRADYQSGYLLALNYDPALAPQAVAAEHLRFGAGRGAGASGPVRRSPGRRLRVGYLSPDLRRHSVAYFFEPLLRAHDREAVEITCYADATASDEVTVRLRQQAEHWRVVAGLSDQALAQAIRADEIDVLVDLAGHTGNNRLALFGARAAPVQVTYLGYPATTGLVAMDHRITDAVADPPGLTEAFHSEHLVRVEGGFLCYAAPFASG